jgi:hypothetical protein
MEKGEIPRQGQGLGEKALMLEVEIFPIEAGLILERWG